METITSTIILNCIERENVLCVKYEGFITSTFPSDFFRLPSLVYVIGGIVLFIGLLLFFDFLRRSIR